MISVFGNVTSWHELQTVALWNTDMHVGSRSITIAIDNEVNLSFTQLLSTLGLLLSLFTNNHSAINRNSLDPVTEQFQVASLDISFLHSCTAHSQWNSLYCPWKCIVVSVYTKLHFLFIHFSITTYKILSILESNFVMNGIVLRACGKFTKLATLYFS